MKSLSLIFTLSFNLLFTLPALAQTAPAAPADASFMVYSSKGAVMSEHNLNHLIPESVRAGHNLLEVTREMLRIFEANGAVLNYQFDQSNYLSSISVRKGHGIKAYAASDFKKPRLIHTKSGKVIKRSYGWCFAINGQVGNAAASETPVNPADQVVWYFGHMDEVKNHFIKGCIPNDASLAAQLKKSSLLSAE